MSKQFSILNYTYLKVYLYIYIILFYTLYRFKFNILHYILVIDEYKYCRTAMYHIATRTNNIISNKYIIYEITLL